MAADLPGCSKKEPPTKKDYLIPSNVEGLLEVSSTLSSHDYHSLVCELIKRSPCSNEELKKQMNLARDKIGKRQVRAHQSKDDAGACRSTPASQVSLICEGNLISTRKVFFLDTEKLTEAKTHAMLSGDLSIVDEGGQLMFWCYINRENVCRFNTSLTGLDKEKISKGIQIATVHDIFAKCFTGKEIWGADLKNDLKSLNLTGDVATFSPHDIQDFYRDSTGKPISLAYLTEHFFGENIQGEKHSSIRDARITAVCYKKMMIFKKQGMTRFSCPVMDELRQNPANNPKKKQSTKFERYKCGGSKSKRKPLVNTREAFESMTVTFSVDDWL